MKIFLIKLDNKILTCKWDIRFPIWTSYVTSCEVIATHTGVCRFIVADHDYLIHCDNTMSKTFVLAYDIRNFVT